MTVETEERINSLFGDALDLPESERNAFVVSATEDPEVQQCVLHMLDEERDLGNFLSPLTLVVDESGADSIAVLRAFDDGQIVDDRYRIERLISSGGMGEVYEAYDLKLEQRIALKTILPRIAGDAQAMSRFLRSDVAAARSVTHPNVCRVFDFGEHLGPEGQIYFLSMQFLAGETLAERLERSGKLQEQEALPLLRQMAEALDAAHRAGVIHRDFKPGNVMLVPDGENGDRAVVMDFGLARSVIAPAGKTTLTQSGQVMGTPDYMAPEQWTGGEASPATDIYALGVVIHEMLAGQRPELSGSDGSRLHQHWKDTIDRCLEKNPESRPQSAGQAVAALDGRTDDESANELHSPRMWNLRRWGFAAIFGFLALIVLFARVQFRENVTAPSGPKRVAVLSFQVGDEDLRVFADGLMESITHRLSQYEGLNEALLVTPASETRRQNVDTAGDARSKFGVDYAVEGSLHRQDDRLRLLLAVVDIASMGQLESVIVEGTREMALSLQDEAVAKLVNVLDLGVKPEHAAELNTLSPVEPAAYEFYVQGLGYLQRNDRLEDIDNAIRLFQHALELDGQYALAYAGLGEAYIYKYLRTTDPRWIDDAAVNAEKAIERGDPLPEVQITMGRVLNQQGRSEEAIVYFNRAIEINARSGMAFEGLAQAYAKLGQTDKAEAAYRGMISQRREDWRAYHQLGLFYKRQGDLRGAIREYQHVIALTPDNATAYSNLGSFYYMDGQFAEARNMWEKSISIEPARAALSNLAQLHMNEERYKNAVKLYEKVAELDAGDYRAWSNLAAAYRRTDSEEKAREANKKSTALAEEMLIRNPKHLGALTHLAFDAAFSGERGRAIKLLQSAEAAVGEDPNGWVRIAEIYAKLREIDDARHAVETAVSNGYSWKALEQNKVLKPILAWESPEAAN